MGHETTREGSSRRDFLRGVGAAGAGVMTTSLSMNTGAQAAPPTAPRIRRVRHRARAEAGMPDSSANFGRIFPECRRLPTSPTESRRPCSRRAGRAASWMPATILGPAPRR